MKKKYIWVKTVEAEPATEHDYLTHIENTAPPTPNDRQGYIVNHENGNITWLQKKEFEETFKELGTAIGVPLFKEDWQPHQQRVSEEAQELRKKITDLSNFIQTNRIYQMLKKEEQNRLKKQLEVMEVYLLILVERINNF